MRDDCRGVERNIFQRKSARGGIARRSRESRDGVREPRGAVVRADDCGMRKRRAGGKRSRGGRVGFSCERDAAAHRERSALRDFERAEAQRCAGVKRCRSRHAQGIADAVFSRAAEMLVRSREREPAVAGSDRQRSREICPIAGKRERARAGFRHRSRAAKIVCDAVVGGKIQLDGSAAVRDRSRAERGIVVRVSRRAVVIGENKTERRRALGFESSREAGKIAREFDSVRDAGAGFRAIDEEKSVAREFSGKSRCRVRAASVRDFYGVVAVAVFQNEILRKGLSRQNEP